MHALAIARRAINVDVEEFGDVDVRLWRLGSPGHQVGIQRMRIGSPSVAVRSQPMLGDGNEDVILHVQLSGPRVVRQLGREAFAPTGSAVFSWNAEASTIVLPEATEFVSIALPYRALRAIDPGIDRRLARTVQADNAVLGLLRRYLGLIEGASGQSEPDVREIMGRHVFDLCARLTGAGDPDALRSSGVGAALLHAMKQDIWTNLSGDVSTRALAIRHRISPRYVQKLFASEGLNVSRYVLDLRLEAVRNRLQDPRWSRKTIAEIVYAAGFGDISTFNRSFRARFGETPSDARNPGRAAP